MIEYARMEPSAPPMSSTPISLTFSSPTPPTKEAPAKPLVAVVPPLNLHQSLSLPPLIYSAPGAVVQNQHQLMSGPVAPALKPMPQPPPAPALNEVSLNEERLRVRCPYCYASIVTKVTYRPGTMTKIVACAMVCTVLFFPLAWVPFVFDCCKDVEHGCPNCTRSIGRFNRFN